MTISTGIPLLPGPAVNNQSFDSQHAFVAGWVSQPNGRGTFDIVWSSLFTVFLCTWTSVCLNLPDKDESPLRGVLRRTKWMFWAIVGPEFVVSFAIGQWSSAQRSVKRFRGRGDLHWTMRHGFFADMGGLLLQPKDSTPFLTNSRQLYYLVERGYLACPQLDGDDIWDKSKADSLARVMTLAQVSWLIIQLIGRAIMRLETTTLEISAAAIVFSTLGTFYCWFHKPYDVRRPVILNIGVSTEQILLDAGEDAKKPYVHTPLDFVAKQSSTVGYDIMGYFGVRFDAKERPLRRLPNDRFPDITTTEKFVLFVMTTAYTAVHLVGWNFSFPSNAEQYLWRIASCILTGVTVLFWAFETIAARHRFGRWDKYLIWLRFKKEAVRDIEGIETEEEKREREMKESRPMPLPWEVALILPLVIIYLLARFYMVVEVFLGLRILPLSVFNTVPYIDLIPHW
ncbi:uncharacterized protein BDR25DRAFT_235064 [Lindgomyces ingoldianus]|uniref:Uncharacterized protein n=1 Tax=Lindgomyces ingoldianus TaxID=673940 RepID=A0ACB6QKH9_9PLEO|nr:uncharacterized protein BDR25DRAFT_235064 [Lindgomyces ingoldianus]KAF2467372.1 hypothetical protein BDR25DRAFT_235064 [Lindgomyces ingoldianus]